MDDMFALRDAIQAAIDNWMIEQGGGFAGGWVAMVDTIDPDGSTSVHVHHPAGQRVYHSLGMANYLTEWFKDDARRQWLPCQCEDCTPEDD